MDPFKGPMGLFFSHFRAFSRVFGVYGWPKTLSLFVGGPYRRTAVNKNDLVQQLSDRTGLSKMDAQKAVDGVFDLITDALKAGDEARISGFGVFVVSTRAGGKGRNPQTGATITIKASKSVRFKASSTLKKRM